MKMMTTTLGLVRGDKGEGSRMEMTEVWEEMYCSEEAKNRETY